MRSLRLPLECVSLALLGFGAELAYSSFHLAFNRNQSMPAMILAVILPFTAFLGSVLFTNTTCIKKRAMYVASGAVGNAAGVWIVMTWF
jgi:hypothetical protein